jgi:hypothetical protein
MARLSRFHSFSAQTFLMPVSDDASPGGTLDKLHFEFRYSFRNRSRMFVTLMTPT